METKSPELLGLDSARLDEASALIQAEIDKGTGGAASLTVARQGCIARSEGFGRRIPGSTEPVTGDAVFLLASISKPLSMCALLQLIEQGDVGLDDPVQMYLSEFSGINKERVCVRHLLTHTSGMPDMLPENVELLIALTPMTVFFDGALNTPLLFEPGTDFRYKLSLIHI